MPRLRSWLLAVPACAGVAGAGLALFAGVVARVVERALPPLGKVVDIDGTRIHYIDEGPSPVEGINDAPAILLIHGLGGQMRNFTFGVAGLLARQHRVVVIDRPGSGYSRRPRGASATLSAQAAVLASFIQALGLQRPTIAGHSLGGAIALALALNHPDDVGALALISPLTHPQENPPEAFRSIAIRSRLRRFLTAWTLAIPASLLNSKQVLGAVFGPDLMPSDFPRRGGGLLSLRPSSFYNASTDMVQCGADLPGMIARYGSVAVPVGVLYGTADRILDHVANGVALSEKIPGLDLELCEGAGHMLPAVAPERTAAFIERTAARIPA